VEGVTFLGGEPFEQAAAAAELAEVTRARGLSVMTFTGSTDGRKLMLWRLCSTVWDRGTTSTTKPFMIMVPDIAAFMVKQARRQLGAQKPIS
jgi:organic radical activating enzyme